MSQPYFWYVRYTLVLIFLRQGTPTEVGAPSPLNRDNLVVSFVLSLLGLGYGCHMAPSSLERR